MQGDVVIFGASSAGISFYNNLINKCNLLNIIGFLDNDKNKWGKKINTVEIFSPEYLYKLDKNTKVIIASIYWKEIQKQLNSMGYLNHCLAYELTEEYNGALYEFKERTKKYLYCKILGVANNFLLNASKEENNKHMLSVKKAYETYHSINKKTIDKKFQAGRLWKYGIEKNVYDLYGALIRKDFHKYVELIYEFRQFATTLGISAEEDLVSMVDPKFNEESFVNDIVSTFEIIKEYISCNIMKQMDESLVGNPLCIDYKDKRLTSEIIRHSYYLSQIDKYKINDLDKSTKTIVLELGGGTGDTARLFKNYYNERITYIILDLPEVLTISTYYLLMNYRDLKIGTYEDFKDVEQIDKHMLTHFDIVLLPNFMIERIANRSIDIMLNTASLGEMEEDIYNMYVGEINRICDKLFYSHNRESMKFQVEGRFTKVGMDNILDPKQWELVSEVKDVNLYKVLNTDYKEQIFLRKNENR